MLNRAHHAPAFGFAEGRSAKDYPSGPKFDSSYERGSPTTFAPNQVIKGWTEAMQLMVEGDKWELYIPSDLAYGDSGRPPKIGGGDCLIFTMEIVKIKASAADVLAMRPTESVLLATLEASVFAATRVTPAVALILVLAPVAWVVGRLFQRLRLPLITGYLCTGLACGPLLGLVRPDQVDGLWAVEGLCLALIALAAGSELHLTELNRQRRPVLIITAVVAASTWVFVFVGFLAASPWLPLARGAGRGRLGAMASLSATLMLARSPATCLAVLTEVGAEGPFSRLVLAVTVLKDTMTMALFSVNLDLVVQLLVPQPQQGPWAAAGVVLQPLGLLAAATALGLVGGLLLLLFLFVAAPPRQESVQGVTTRRASRCPACATTAVIAGTTGLLYALAEAAGLEGLLVCLVAGLVAANRPGERGGRARAALDRCLVTLVPANSVIFFALVGAQLQLPALAGTAGPACLLVVVRLAALFCGGRAGGWVAGCPAEHRGRIWLAMVTQAGVALGLAKGVTERFPDWGPDFTALLVAVIVLNQLIGPPMFKAALVNVGEVSFGAPTRAAAMGGYTRSSNM
jgi:Kef-type K+ transport system membrane component KefB